MEFSHWGSCYTWSFKVLEMLLAAAGIILKNHKILLLQRTRFSKRYPNHWGCPGGKALPFETPEENAIREIKEECNLDFTPTEILKIGHWNGKKFYRFLGDWEGNIKIQEEEVQNYKWCTFEEAKQLEISFDFEEILDLLITKELII